MYLRITHDSGWMIIKKSSIIRIDFDINNSSNDSEDTYTMVIEYFVGSDSSTISFTFDSEIELKRANQNIWNAMSHDGMSEVKI